MLTRSGGIGQTAPLAGTGTGQQQQVLGDGAEATPLEQQLQQLQLQLGAFSGLDSALGIK